MEENSKENDHTDWLMEPQKCTIKWSLCCLNCFISSEYMATF